MTGPMSRISADPVEISTDVEFPEDNWLMIDRDSMSYSASDDLSMSYSSDNDDGMDESSKSAFSFEWITEESSLDSKALRPSVIIQLAPEMLWERTKSPTGSEPSGYDAELESSESSTMGLCGWTIVVASGSESGVMEAASEVTAEPSFGSEEASDGGTQATASSCSDESTATNFSFVVEIPRLVCGEKDANEKGIVIDWERVGSIARNHAIYRTCGDNPKVNRLKLKDTSSDLSSSKLIPRLLLKRKFRFPSQRALLEAETTIVWIRNESNMSIESDSTEVPTVYDRSCHGGCSIFEAAKKWFERRIPERRRAGGLDTLDALWVRHLQCPAIGDGLDLDLPVMILMEDFVWMPVIALMTHTKEPRQIESSSSKKESLSSWSIAGRSFLHSDDCRKADKLNDESSIISSGTLETHVSKFSDDHDHWEYDLII